MFKNKKVVGKELKLKILPDGYSGTFLVIGNKYKIIGSKQNLYKINTPEGLIELFKDRFE